MSAARPDPVDVWAPMFAYFTGTSQAKYTDEQILAMALSHADRRWCNLCDARVPDGEESDAHVRQHGRELADWRKRKGKMIDKDRAERLKLAREERKRQRELGIEPAPRARRPTGRTKRRKRA